MKRIFVLVGMWASVAIVAGACLAAEPKKPNNQPAAVPAPPAPPGPPPARPPAAPKSTPAKVSGGGLRSVAPPASGGVNTNRRAAEARHAAQAAAAAQQAAAAAAVRNEAATHTAAAATAAAASARQNNHNHHVDGNDRNPPYGYGNNNYYSPYGYSPYRHSYSPYGYVPPGTTPYVLGYDPSTGAAFLAPYEGGDSPYYPQYYNPYPYYRNPYLGYGYPTAVFAPAGLLYGLGPIQQLMGVDHLFRQPQANANGLANGNPNQFANGNGNPGFANKPNAVRHDADPPVHKPAAPAGGKAMEIAWKFITFGDAHFGNQKFIDALDRYRRATRECPGLSDAWFRQGFALAALGRYEQAAKAMRRGLEEKPGWVDSNFRLGEIYGDDAAEKKSLLEKMVKAAEEEPTNGDLAYVVGVHLYCDGKPDQAAPFFRRVAQIRGTDAEVKPFLAK